MWNTFIFLLKDYYPGNYSDRNEVTSWNLGNPWWESRKYCLPEKLSNIRRDSQYSNNVVSMPESTVTETQGVPLKVFWGDQVNGGSSGRKEVLIWEKSSNPYYVSFVRVFLGSPRTRLSAFVMSLERGSVLSEAVRQLQRHWRLSLRLTVGDKVLRLPYQWQCWESQLSCSETFGSIKESFLELLRAAVSINVFDS